jgi:hypothetical protein
MKSPRHKPELDVRGTRNFYMFLGSIYRSEFFIVRALQKKRYEIFALLI